MRRAIIPVLCVIFLAAIGCDDNDSSCKGDKCGGSGVCGDGIVNGNEQCDGADLGGATCANVDPNKPFGVLGCTPQCTLSTAFCGKADLGLQASKPKAESTDAQCTNGLNDFHTQNKDGSESSWFDCSNNHCKHSPVVQVCGVLENTDAACSDNAENPQIATLRKDYNAQNVASGIDCANPSCYKNWRVTVCAAQAPRWELGADCGDHGDNDGDGLVDCDDPDCLHAGASSCALPSGKKRILFDNAHHEIAGNVDWILDVTGRHPFPSIPKAENEWHGLLSSFGLDLMKTGDYILETLPEDRALTYQKAGSVQDLSNYDILVLPEPSAEITKAEAEAVLAFVKAGGGLLLIANHEGADRDGNGYDSVRAINEMLANMPGATSKESNPFGFYVLPGSFKNNSTTKVADGAEASIVTNRAGTIRSTGMYGAAGFQIVDATNVKPVLYEKNSTEAFAVSATMGSGRIVAIGDSAIIGDGTNFLGLTLGSENGYVDNNLDNRILLLNAIDWLAGK